jgi:alcohol dehydrogenase (cytochrome c)/quinohemoprotein ethanol dehydrogenase
MAYDPELNLLYFGTDNGSPWNHGVRSQGKGDNLFLASIMAVRPDTGAYVWHYQVNPAEAWDFSATQHIILADLKIAGRTRKVLMQVPKNGFLYVLDRVTGELLSAKATVPMTWATGVDMKTGRPIENPEARYYNTGKPFVLSPSGVGAHNWHPMSFSPLTGLVYVPMNQTPLTYIDARGEIVTKQKTNTLVQYIFGPPPANLPIGGWLAAWDPVAGREVWRAPRVGPWNGGVLSTAGGLVFQGTVDGRLVVNAAEDGKELWNFDAQTGVMAGPISYAIDGEQYVAVAAGWGGALAMGGGGRLGATGQNRVLIFKLDGKAVLPAKPAELVLPLNPPSEPQSAAIVAQGRDEYVNYCARCHGQQVLTGGVTPDLLRTPILNSDEAWYSVVLDGALATKGMAGFGTLMDKKRAASIRAYVISEAQKAKASEAKH